MNRDRRRAPYGPGQPGRGIKPSQVVLVESRFRFLDRPTWFGRARLYSDRMELRHWTARGPVRLQVPLHQVLDFNYHPADETGNVRLEVECTGAVNLLLDEAHLWRSYFEGWLHYAVSSSAKFNGTDIDRTASISG